MFCIHCHEVLTKCKCKKVVVHEMTLSHSNVVQKPKPRAIVAMLCTTAAGKNLSPFLLANAYALQGFDSKDDTKFFAMAVAVNRRRTFVTREMLTRSKDPPKLRLIPDLGQTSPKNIFCMHGNKLALSMLGSFKSFDKSSDALEKELRDEVLLVEKFTDFPLVALGFTWPLTWRVEGHQKLKTCTDEKAAELFKEGFVVWEQDWAEKIGGCTPFGQFRAMAKIGAAPFVELFQQMGCGVFIHIGDSDPVSLHHTAKFRGGTRSGLISRYHAALDECALSMEPHEPCVLTGGYRVNFGEVDGETLDYVAAAVEQEMQIRALLHDVHGDLPYYSEANLLLNCSTPDLFKLLDFGKSDLEWNVYRQMLVKAGIITKDRDHCHLALKWDPRCVLTTHAGRMHDTFVSSPPRLSRPERQDTESAIWQIRWDGTPVVRLLLLREESVLSELRRKTIDYLARAVLGQLVQSSLGSRRFAAMLFKMGRIERSSTPPEPVNDIDVRLSLCKFVKEPRTIGVFDRGGTVKSSGSVKSLKEMAFDVLTPLTQVAMSSAKFKGLRMGGDKLDPTNRVIGLKQFYLLGMLGAHNSVEESESPIQPDEPYSIGLLPYLMGHEEVVTLCETIFETVWRDVTEKAEKELLIVKETEKKSAYKRAEELLFKFIRSSVETEYVRELEETLEALTEKSIRCHGRRDEPLCDVIPVVPTKKGLVFKSICAVPTSSLTGEEDTLSKPLQDLAAELIEEEQENIDLGEEEDFVLDLSNATLEVIVAPKTPLRQATQGDGDVWTGPSTVIPEGGIFEMDL